jgi:hypothetical protein
MVKDGPVEGRCDGTGELLVSVPSACKTISQIAIGKVSVRMSVMMDTKAYTRKLISLCRYSYEST